MNRRAFLRSAAAMATVTVLAPLVPASSPRLWGDGMHDDTAALQAMIDRADRAGATIRLPRGEYLVSSTLTLRSYMVVEGVTLLARQPVLDRVGGFWKFLVLPKGTHDVRITDSVFRLVP